MGWHVRFERRFGPRTRLLVATEGILTARLQGDPLLSGFATVVLDEFHERSLHADVALALVKQAAAARGDLAVVVMSATLDPGPVAEYLGGCPVLEVTARTHPVEVSYASGPPTAAIREVLTREGGHVLCFLPGGPEIRRVSAQLGTPRGVRVLPLHGSLDAAAQDTALAESRERKVILVSRGPEGAAWALPEAPLARGPVDGGAQQPGHGAQSLRSLTRPQVLNPFTPPVQRALMPGAPAFSSETSRVRRRF